MIRHPRFRQMAIGWRMLSFFGMAQVFKFPLNYYAVQTYSPLIGAYLRKYSEVSANDAFEINDRKREYYQIDTSDYMNYTEASLREDGMHMHVNHGPQPSRYSILFLIISLVLFRRSLRCLMSLRIAQVP